MIQRIQTVYLFAIIILALITCSGQIIDFQDRIPGQTETQGTAIAYQLNSEIQYGLIILVSLIVGWTLNIILKFKNRKRQLLLTKINFIIIGSYLAAVLAKAFTQIPNFTFANMTLKASIGLALIFFMLYLNLRALLLIRKDEELVKSVDRLR